MAGFVRETCGPRPLVGGHEVGAQILLQAIAEPAAHARAARADAEPDAPAAACATAAERAVALGVRAAAVPGLDRVVAHGARALAAARRPASG